MPAVPLTRETVADFKQRFESLTPDSERKFGSMDALSMMRHLRNALETGLGDVTYEDKSTPIVSRLLFLVLTRVLTTWPGGKITVPDFWTPPPDRDFDAEREKLFGDIDRFLDAAEAAPEKKAPHPFFGDLSLREWGRLNGIHFHHHLRQFGV